VRRACAPPVPWYPQRNRAGGPLPDRSDNLRGEGCHNTDCPDSQPCSSGQSARGLAVSASAAARRARPSARRRRPGSRPRRAAP
jgi:hypothetical protein